MSKQPRALELADQLEQCKNLLLLPTHEKSAIRMLRRQHEVIAELVVAFGRLEAAYVVSHSAQQRFDAWQQARAARANAQQLQGETE